MASANPVKQLEVDEITQSQLDPLYKDYTSEEFSNGLTKNQNAFRQQVAELFQAPDVLNNASPDEIVSGLISEGNRVGGVDDIVARASRDVMRLKGQSLDDSTVSDLFSAYGIKLPPTSDIKFQGYDSLDDEHEKIDGWAAQAKSAYNLKTRAKHPELLAYRDDVFQKIDDASKSLKKKVGATDSAAVDFLGRLGEGAASFLDSVNLDGVGNFIRKHVATNPEWDSDVSSVVGQALGQGVALVGAGFGIAAAGAAAGIGAAGITAVEFLGLGLSNLNATQKQREQEILDATGSKNLAEASATDTSAYVEAGIDTVVDASVLGLNKLGAGKLAKKFVGNTGRKLVGEGLVESLNRTAGKLENMRTAAGTAGDVIWNGTKEGATEALQGVISDTSVGNYTNMKDKFDPYDVRNRAADFLGGVAGGVGITVANSYFLPKERLGIQEETPPAEVNLDDRIRSAGQDFINAPTVDDAADANLRFINDAALNVTQNLLSGETVDIPQMPNPIVAEEQKARDLNVAALYTGMKESLGDLINHPHVQAFAEASLDMLNKARAYTPAPRPKDVEKTAEIPATIDLAPVAEVTVPAEKLVVNPEAPPEATLTALETQLDNFNTTIKTALPGGGASFTFSLASDGDQGKKAEIKDATTAGKLDASNKDGTSIKGKNALRINANTYTVSTDAEGNPTSFVTKTPDGKSIVDTTIDTPERLQRRVEGILNRQKTSTENLQARTNLGLTSNKAYQAGVPLNVTQALPEAAQRFAKTVFDAGSGGGGNQALKQAAADTYVENGQAFEDLTDAGLSEDQALSYLEKIRNVNTPEFRTARIDGVVNPKQKVRREALNALHLDLAHNLLGRAGLEPVIKDAYSPTVQGNVLDALGYTGLAEEVKNEPAKRVDDKIPDLSTNAEIQRRALVNRFGNEERALQVIEQAKTNPEIRTAIEKAATDYLTGYGVPPTATLEEALTQADIKSTLNRGAFKTKKSIPLNRSLFGLGRVLDKLGIKYETSPNKEDFESNISGDPLAGPLLRNTGQFNPTTGIRLSAQILRGQQGAFTGWHELGEAALYGSESLRDLIARSPTLYEAAKDVSNSIRQSPTYDPTEYAVDAVSQYLYDKEALSKTHPELVAALDSYASNSQNAGTDFSKIVQAVADEDAIPDNQKLDEFSAQAAEASRLASEALANRKLDQRPFIEKVRDLLHTAHITFFNSAANAQQAAQDLVKSKSPMAALGETFNNYFAAFKNRQQVALVASHTIKNGFTSLEKTGVSREQVNEFLSNNRILNEKAFWEQTIAKANLSADAFKQLLNGSEGIKNLIENDESLKTWINAIVGNDALVNSDAMTTILNELSAMAYAQSTDGAIRGQLKHIQDPKLRAAIGAAFDPTVTVGLERPVEVIGQTARGNLQNSANVNRDVAAHALENLRNKMTPEQYAGMETFAKEVLAPFTRLGVSELQAAGAISQETADFYLGNADNYVTFQLADALQADPYVDAAMRRQEGMHGLRGAPLESTMLKVGGMRTRAAVQNFANNIANIYYELDKDGKKDTIRPVAATASRGPGTNDWVNRNASGLKEIPLHELITLKGTLEGAAKKLGEEKSYVLSAEDGDYVLHELDDPTITDLFSPSDIGHRNTILRTLNNIQTWKRAILTTNNPGFAVRSLQRAASNLYKNRNAPRDTQPTWTELGKAILNAPIGGLPLNKNDRQLMWHAYKEAFNYTKNFSDPTRTLGTIDEFFGAGTTYQDLMNNPLAINILVRQGFLPASIEEDLSSGVSAEVAGQTWGNIFSPTDEGALDNFIAGKAKQRNILRRAADYIPGDTGKKIANGIANSTEKYLNFVRSTNNSLELGEKYMGLLAYLQDGVPFNEALFKADMTFGNPESRGGGSARSLIAPFILYSTSTLNGLRVVGDTVKGARNPLQDQRAARAIGLGARNSLAMAALPSVVYALAKATGSGDDDAEDQAAVIDRLLTNIPESDRKNGLAIPFGFRDPRTGEIHMPVPGFGPKLADIDPSWTTAYLSLPYDQATGVFQSVVGLATDLLSSGVGTSAAAANFLSSSLGQSLPGPGPVVNAGINAYQISRGINPTDLFTGNQAVSDEDYARGGTQLGAKYVQHLLNEFVPLIPGPAKSPFDKTKMLEPTGYSVLDQIPALLKLGVVKDSNFGQIQQNRRQLGLRDEFHEQVQDATSSDVKNYLNRTNELQREATRLLQVRRDELLSKGESPKNAVKRAADLLPAALREELLKGQHWKRQSYDRLREKAEIALRAGDTAAYKQFISDLDTSIE